MPQADRKFGWLQFDATEEMVRMVGEYQRLLAPEHVVELEEDPHVTVLYGIEENNPNPLRRAMRSELAPGPWELGKLSLFRNKNAHVLKVNVRGPALHTLRAALTKTVPYKATFSGFIPHLTIAYMVPGTADQYVGLGTGWQEGLKSPGDVLVFHSKDRQRYELPL